MLAAVLSSGLLSDNPIRPFSSLRVFFADHMSDLRRQTPPDTVWVDD
ncbi:MAG: hypothetical protein F6K00_30580 [Leptolyngbya sp. SIOISBB]|nr:hypothetical protein [Leptolyngbya sp. SIOISBB]